MAIVALSEINDEYQLVHSEQDIYGWPVVDATGTTRGTVAELMVDTEAERVSSIVLDTREEYPASDITIGDGVVRISAKTGARRAGPLDDSDIAGSSSSASAESDPSAYAATSDGLATGTAETGLELADVERSDTPEERAFERGWVHVRRRVRDEADDERGSEFDTGQGERPTAIDNDDLRREEETDRKVGVLKDAKRVAEGDIKGVIRDDVEEMKADFDAVDDKVEKALGTDKGE